MARGRIKLVQNCRADIGVFCWSGFRALLGGSWVVRSGVISPLIWLISIATLLVTLLITTHEPPSRIYRKVSEGVGCQSGFRIRADAKKTCNVGVSENRGP